MENRTQEDLSEARQAIADMIQRSVRAQQKSAQDTAAHSLLTHRIRALHIAAGLLNREEAARRMEAADTGEETERGMQTLPALKERAEALAPIQSLLHKSQKARLKCAEGAWQHRMLGRNLKALEIALAVLKA